MSRKSANKRGPSQTRKRGDDTSPVFTPVIQRRAPSKKATPTIYPLTKQKLRTGRTIFEGREAQTRW